jgi:hypothetical protein
MAGTIGVMRLADYVDDYQRHPEAKAADRDGNPAGPETIGLLGRLRVRSKKLARIGKEVDRPVKRRARRSNRTSRSNTSATI